MSFKVRWTGPARREFTEVVDWISADNPSAASDFRDELFSRVDSLGQFPRSGAIYVRRRGLEIRQITYGNYRVFYQVRPRLQRIDILSIWHGARREPRLRR